jgi:RNA polymerase sporulation-specific sigma factor
VRWDATVENNELLQKIKQGDSDALRILTEQNTPLVKKIALRFIGRGVEYEDLTQIGMIGMIKAARSFDFSYECTFSTYAVPLIMGEIRRFLRDDGPIKVGRSIKQKGAALLRHRESFIAEHEREPKISELAALTGFDAGEIAYCLEASAAVLSLCEPIGNSDEGLTIESSLADDSASLEGLTDRIALGEAIRKLPPLWRKIIHLRYFDELSQSETGKKLGLTQVKISREEQKILIFLRKELVLS